MKKIKLSRHESIIAAVAEPCAGPGWSNAPIMVHIMDNSTGKYRNDFLQPKDQTPEMQILYRICAATHHAMIAAVMAQIKRTKGSEG